MKLTKKKEYLLRKRLVELCLRRNDLKLSSKIEWTQELIYLNEQLKKMEEK